MAAGRLAEETGGLAPKKRASLREAVHDPDKHVRTEAVTTLARAKGQEQYIAKCKELPAANGEEWPHMSVYGHIGVFARKRHPELASLLARSLRDEDETARSVAIWMTDRLPPKAVQYLNTSGRRPQTTRQRW